tara:strand:+ start:45 stop:353 length:309 start_codon:yes stop_codon:yes gene_type:complete
MKLLTKTIEKKLPKLYTSENIEDPMVVCKFFQPWGEWTWYAIEFDGKDTFFGYVQGWEGELGYFSLSELKSVIGPFGMKIERDLYFQPQKLSKIKDNNRRSA